MNNFFDPHIYNPHFLINIFIQNEIRSDNYKIDEYFELKQPFYLSLQENPSENQKIFFFIISHKGMPINTYKFIFSLNENFIIESQLPIKKYFSKQIVFEQSKMNNLIHKLRKFKFLNGTERLFKTDNLNEIIDIINQIF